VIGPFCFFKDYVAFIEGTASHVKKSEQNDNHVNHNNHHDHQPEVPVSEIGKKLFTTLVFGISTVLLLPRFPASMLTDPEFRNYSFLYKNVLLVFLMSITRHKYYFAWKLGELVNASCGLCFNGYDENGKARWDLVDNADIPKIEFATSNKQLLDNWNTTNGDAL